MNQHPVSLLRLPSSGPRKLPLGRSDSACRDPERAQFLADLARRRREGTLDIDPVAIAEAILRRERS
ncbi:MAG: hypothetical protein J0L92_19035 [Deltaproteobacteria bacterium]|nr:hypothetical protein [Deltaproteobacteria bacterium]